jgi:hypothetical protein
MPFLRVPAGRRAAVFDGPAEARELIFQLRRFNVVVASVSLHGV